MPELRIYDSIDFQEVEDISDIKAFYRLLYNLNQATLLMSQAQSLDDFYRKAIVTVIKIQIKHSK